MNDRNQLIKSIILSGESDCVEFKQNNSSPPEIGEYISALSNTAALSRNSFGYMIWGVDDNKMPVGTEFKPELMKVGNEELHNWLITQLEPQIYFEFSTQDYDDKRLVLLKIECAKTQPVRFRGESYIRIGTYKKKLKDHPGKESELWKVFHSMPIEEQVVMEGLSAEEVGSLINYEVYYSLIHEPAPPKIEAVVSRLVQERMLNTSPGNKFLITYQCAILLARDLKRFPSLERKAVRFVSYRGIDRIQAYDSFDGTKGYASGFQGLIKFITMRLPHNEVIKEGIRVEVPLYPEIAIREVVANALIHQDLSIRGAGPMIELFADRIEISNPGIPLIETLRFIDEPPITRNERIADLMRRMGICEERGSGIDKVVSTIEFYQLPAPEFRKSERSTIVTLYAPKPFSNMDREDRIRACYQHTCLMYITNRRMSNSSLRARFGLKDSSYTLVSRVIKDTIEKKLIKPASTDQAKRNSTYLPYWE